MDVALTDLLGEYELLARERLPAATYDYIAAGAGDELSLDEARVAWRRHRLRPRVFPDATGPDLSIEVLGTRLSAPILVAPTAYHQLAHPEGEVETARGVSAAGGLLVVTTRATAVIEDIAAALDGPWWFQVYVVRERRLTEGVVRRAAAAGAKALMLTADTPYIGFKRRGHHAPVSFEQHLVNFGAHLAPDAQVEEVAASLEQDPAITFDTIEWLRDLTGLPVLVKGVLRGDDAAACLDAGAAGVVVSNHGGRQLDRAVAPAVALPEVVAAVEGRGPVLVDGGIRSGTDILVALALGAAAILLGRPVLWGLAAAGSAGVAAVLSGFRDELDHAMGLAGVASVSAISRDLLA